MLIHSSVNKNTSDYLKFYVDLYIFNEPVYVGS